LVFPNPHRSREAIAADFDDEIEHVAARIREVPDSPRKVCRVAIVARVTDPGMRTPIHSESGDTAAHFNTGIAPLVGGHPQTQQDAHYASGEREKDLLKAGTHNLTFCRT
jgi:hypothetical protein